MSAFRDPVKNFTFETVGAFVATLLVLPLLLKLVALTVRGLFRMSFFRRLLLDTAIVGATALLTREDVLDKLFGRRSDREGARSPLGASGEQRATAPR